MSALKRINNLGKSSYKETMKLNSMEIDKEYLIENIRKINTKFGEAVIVKLEDFQVFLPKRASILSIDEINTLNTQNITLTYKGIKDKADIFEINEIPEDTFA